MEKRKAIPKGYMTVGEVANKMGVTVRTLQHYDRVGLLSHLPEAMAGAGCIPTRILLSYIKYYR